MGVTVDEIADVRDALGLEPSDIDFMGKHVVGMVEVHEDDGRPVDLSVDGPVTAVDHVGSMVYITVNGLSFDPFWEPKRLTIADWVVV